MSDTNYYRRALCEWQYSNPLKRRSTDVTPIELGLILQRAQEIKDEEKAYDAEKIQHLRGGYAGIGSFRPLR